MNLDQTVNQILSDYYRVKKLGSAAYARHDHRERLAFFDSEPRRFAMDNVRQAFQRVSKMLGLYDAFKERTSGRMQSPLCRLILTRSSKTSAGALCEALLAKHGRIVDHPLVRKAYYAVRDLMPVVGAQASSESLPGRLAETCNSPTGRWILRWTRFMKQVLRLAMEAGGVQRVPFIWFWPHGAPNCLIMTHDVETAAGRDFTSD